MNILFVILPVTLFLALAILYFFVWSIRSGQFDDVEGEKFRILFDDEA